MLLWAAVVALALSLVAMHQLSGGHVAADPTPPVGAGPFDGGHAAAYVASALSAADSDSAPGTYQLRAERGHDAPLQHGSSAPAGDCHGCADRQAMALTCLVALALLALGWLLARPVRWPGHVRRRRSRTVLRDARRRWKPVTPSLVELSVSRT